MINSSEVIIIGTGPISLLKCWILLKKENVSKITLLDSKTTYGGAWYYDHHDTHKIETGCHIWSYCPAVYNFISKELEIPLTHFKTQPIFKIGKLNLPYSTKNTVDSYLYLLKGLVRLDFKIFSKIKNSSRYYLRLFGKTNLYPKLGSIELVYHLHKKISTDKRVEFIFEKSLKKIEINNNITIETSDNKNLTADKIFITSTGSLDELVVNNKPITYKTSTTNYIHFKIELNSRPNKTASYVRVANDHIIHRISDISYLTENNNHILLIAVFEKCVEKMDQNEIFNHIKEYLIRHKIIHKTSEIKITKKYEFPTHYTNQETRNNINNLNAERIELMHSTDLMYGMHELLTKEGII